RQSSGEVDYSVYSEWVFQSVNLAINASLTHQYSVNKALIHAELFIVL
ncbi:uncharacterized protein METZ01_LOCUS479450, partial [marine metagenome]